MRSDLTAETSNIASTNGIPLDLTFTVYSVEGTSCTPLEGAQVDLWSADTLGLYSNMCNQGTVGDDSLRGYQITDADGLVRFKTTFPGWYEGRTVHLHVKIRFASGTTQLVDFTTILYVADELVDRIMATEPYNSRGPRDKTNATDFLFAEPPPVANRPTIILTAADCAAIAAGGLDALGVDPALFNSVPNPLTESSAGPKLLLNIQEKSGGGLSGEFSFGVKFA